MVRPIEATPLRMRCWYLPAVLRQVGRAIEATRQAILDQARQRLFRLIAVVFRTYGPEGIFARTLPPGITSLWVAVLLAFTLLLYYF